MSLTLASILDYICSCWWVEPLFSLSFRPTLAPLAIPKLNTQIKKKKLTAIGFDVQTPNHVASCMYLVCVLFAVGGWLKANCHNWTVAKLKLHFIVAYNLTNVNFWQLSLCQPTNQHQHKQLELEFLHVPPIFVVQVGRAEDSRHYHKPR